eukprot:403332391
MSSAGATVLKQVSENIQVAQNSKSNRFKQQNQDSNLNVGLSQQQVKLNQTSVSQENQRFIKESQHQSQYNEQTQVYESQEVVIKKLQEQNEANGFFLTGVNTNGQIQDQEEEIFQGEVEEAVSSADQLQSEQDAIIDNYELISVIDANKALSNDSFIQNHRSDKLILNIADIQGTSNIGGFNISNFKMRYLNEFIGDIITDYEQSYIGCFTKQLITEMQDQNLFRSLELYMSVTLFEGDSGFSLVQGDDQEELLDDVNDYNHTENIKQPNQVRLSQSRVISSPNRHRSNSNKKQNNIPENQQYLLMSQSPSDPYKDNQIGQVTNVTKNKKQMNGTLLEYKLIEDMPALYSAFTQANLRHRVLKRKNQDKQSLDNSVIQNIGELNDEIILIQFKLISKETEKTVNTFSFLNIPLQKQNDTNLQNLQNILIKQKQPPNQSKAKDFIPYNKSILTRILAPIIHKENYTIITHFTKKACLSHLNYSSTTNGLASGLFLFIDKIFLEKRFKKRKLNNQEALKILQKKFSKEVKDIYHIFQDFRDGVQSFETYSEQLSNANQNQKVQNFSLFHQILHFLALKEDIEMNGGPLANSKFLSEEEIQKVIFDKQYIKYLRKKIREELGTSQQNQSGLATKLNKLQQVQYDCIKSELKEDYDKKVLNLQQKLMKKSQKDPSLVLFSQFVYEQTAGNKNQSSTPLANAGINHSFTGAGRNMQALSMNKRHQSQGLKDNKFSAISSKVSNEKDRFYEFYLKSAQKAIDIMRQKQQIQGSYTQSQQNLDPLNRTGFDQRVNFIHQSDIQSQSSLTETRSIMNLNKTYHKQNLGSGKIINQQLRSSSSRKVDRTAYQDQQDFNKPRLQQKLQPLFKKQDFIQQENGLERIEEKLKRNKLNDTSDNNHIDAYSNIDRKTSANTYSRGAISSQQRKFRQPQNYANTINSQINKTQTDISLPKPQSELSKVKEFVPLRAQGKLRALNNINQQDISGNSQIIPDYQSHNDNTRYNQNTSNLYKENSVLYEMRDIKRKPQTAQRQKRIPINPPHNYEYQSNHSGIKNASSILNPPSQTYYRKERTNSLSKPQLLKKDSSNFKGTVLQSEILNNNYMSQPTKPNLEYQGDSQQPLLQQLFSLE